MQAELVYPIIDALSDAEKHKIIERLKLDMQIKKKKKKVPEMPTDFEARAYLINNFLKKKIKL